MTFLRIIMTVRPEKRKEVLQTLLSIINLPETADGHLSCKLFCDIRDENVFNLISQWESRLHLDQHMRSDRFSVLLGTKSLLAQPVKVQIFTISDAEEIEAVHFARKKETGRSPVGAA